jgi:hypothetical protein
LPLAIPSSLAMILSSAAMPSSMYVKVRFWVPPSTSLIGSPRTM